MNIADLLDAAKAEQRITSDNKLAIKLETGSAVVSQWRRQRYFPGDATILTLCNMAKIPPEIGLLWAASWRSEGDARKMWEKLANQASKKAKLPAPLCEAA